VTEAGVTQAAGPRRAARSAAAGRRLVWRVAELIEKVAETPTAATLVLGVGDWPGHRAGQHVDVRLTTEDGYQAQRSYSIASPPEQARLALTVERIDDGEVSPYLVDEMRPGDVAELRGPIGGWFVWEAADGGPLLLVGGGSGVVPLMAMVRHRVASRATTPTRLVLSARGPRDVIYAAELEQLADGADGVEVLTTLTRQAPPGWTGLRGRLDRELLARVAWPPSEAPRVFICGPTGFVEAAASAAVELGHDPGLVKTERFGPTGGAS
jgi:ferredoxin-NADP reductase